MNQRIAFYLRIFVSIVFCLLENGMLEKRYPIISNEPKLMIFFNGTGSAFENDQLNFDLQRQVEYHMSHTPFRSAKEYIETNFIFVEQSLYQYKNFTGTFYNSEALELVEGKASKHSKTHEIQKLKNMIDLEEFKCVDISIAFIFKKFLTVAYIKIDHVDGITHVTDIVFKAVMSDD